MERRLTFLIIAYGNIGLSFLAKYKFSVVSFTLLGFLAFAAYFYYHIKDNE